MHLKTIQTGRRIRVGLITNKFDLQNDDDRGGLIESEFLAKRLRLEGLQVHVLSPGDVTHRGCRNTYDVFLLRNVWPIDVFENSLKYFSEISRNSSILFYNPPDDAFGFIDNKTSLIRMQRVGLPVIPTIWSKSELHKLGAIDKYVVKPINGCSSKGVRFISRDEVEAADTEGCVIQPFISFKREVSFFFIDGRFLHAISSKPIFSDKQNSTFSSLEEHFQNRWRLRFWVPKIQQVKWAQRFVHWLNLPYGLVRVDAALMADGSLKLMELERNCPHLSLLELRERLNFRQENQFAKALALSLKQLGISKRNTISKEMRLS